MKNLLLDTQALLWLKAGSRKLGPRARREIERNTATTRISAVCAWEIVIKSRLGRLKVVAPLHTWMPEELERDGFQILGITVDHAVAVASLPDHHTDQFDRMLIAQAQVEELTIVTSDTAFDAYDVKILDART